MAFYCVNDGVPESTTRLLREACASRGVEYVEIHAPLFDYRDERQLQPGELLYRPAISMTAIRVEQFLYVDGVATFYADPEVVYFSPMAAAMLFQRAGLDIPLTFYCPTPDRQLLSGYVERLGGFPVVVKMLGYSRGIGVIRVDSLPALYSVMDFATAEGKTPQLMAYVDDAVHWRLTVVGDRIASAYRNTQEIDDFRTYAGENRDDYTAPVPPGMAELAVGAVRALRYEFGGVDVLQHPSGRLYLLESNFPCYFATAQEAIGTDIAGMMVEHLMAKSAKLMAG
ncbi:MAG TPA: hypothetical protein VND92_11855 [Vicinamibacterales bacterium]|nr:hypothetical protein [Vicinamibacterales bacterium]